MTHREYREAAKYAKRRFRDISHDTNCKAINCDRCVHDYMCDFWLELYFSALEQARNTKD